MPLMVINLGGEMMYILEQRLVAQKIQPDKARKVGPSSKHPEGKNAPSLARSLRPERWSEYSSACKNADRVAYLCVSHCSR